MGHDVDFDPARRKVLQALAAAGIGTAVFQRSVAAQVADSSSVTIEMLQQAEWIAGLELTDEERTASLGSVQQALKQFDALRAVPLTNADVPALAFHVAPWQPKSGMRDGSVVAPAHASLQKPKVDDDLSFLTVAELAALVRTKQVSSVELTRSYLDRLRRYNPVLKCVVTYTEESALAQAEQADREIASGQYRGPLHGIPWGAKDLIAFPGYPTTWGAAPFREQMLDTKATVIQRLEDAGAVLVAKLSLGALGMGDQWFGGVTKCPWNRKIGSSGSSAGSASATSAGLVGFAIGSETHGSIVSPCRRCGVTGLRPTFGRVSRHGCMALSWSMDKLGPIARTVEDCALVFGAIHGFDGRDPSALDQPFSWPAARKLGSYRVGYFESEIAADERPELDVLRKLGVTLVPIKLPDEYPVGALMSILNMEAAAVFDEITRNKVSAGLNIWPRVLRQGQFVPAVEYLRANRIRLMLMRRMDELFQDVDLYVGGDDLAITNLTGHPQVVLPNGMRITNNVEMPTALTFTGRLFGETDLLAVAHAYQLATGHHLRRPPMHLLIDPIEAPR